jgi:hypothetical protein
LTVFPLEPNEGNTEEEKRVTSSLNKIPTDQLGNRVVVRGEGVGGVTPPEPTLFFKDDVNGFPPSWLFASW